MPRSRNVDLSIDVEGLRRQLKALREAGDGLDKELKGAGKAAAELVAMTARDRVPVRSGRARDSVRAVVSYGGGAVRAGGSKAPYYPWLDWGGRVGRNRSVERPFVKTGRYIYPALAQRRDDVLEKYAADVRDILRSADLT